MSIFNDEEFPPPAASLLGRKNAVVVPEKKKKGAEAATLSSSPPQHQAQQQQQQQPDVSKQAVRQPPPPPRVTPPPQFVVPPMSSTSSGFAGYNYYYAQQPPPYQYQQQFQPFQPQHPSAFTNAASYMLPPQQQLPYPPNPYYQHPFDAAVTPPSQSFDTATQRRRNKLGLIIFLANCEAIHEVYSRDTTKMVTNTQWKTFHNIANLAIVLSKTCIETDDPHITQLSSALTHDRVSDVRETVSKRRFIVSVEENAYALAGTCEDELVEAISRTFSWFVGICIADEIDKATVPKILEFVLSIR